MPCGVVGGYPWSQGRVGGSWKGQRVREGLACPRASVPGQALENHFSSFYTTHVAKFAPSLDDVF